MKERLDAIKENALSQIKATDSLDKLNDIRVAFLGKKGELTDSEFRSGCPRCVIL